MNEINSRRPAFTKIMIVLHHRSDMKALLLVLLMAWLIPSAVFCQHLPAAQENTIPVCCGVTAADNEFSGLTRWRNYILLIPQHVSDTDVHQIIAIDTLSIDSVLQHQSDTVYKYTTIRFDTSLRSIIHAVQKANKYRHNYGGFEAAVAVGDSLFFTVETDSLCFVVKGIIKAEKHQYRVVFKSSDTMSLPKPDYLFDNAGFESLTYLPSTRQLVSFYENNNLQQAPTGYVFNTSFSSKQPLYFDSALLFRLTDITLAKDSAGNDVLLGINYFYNDFKKDTAPKITEFDYYLTGDTGKVYSSRQLMAAQRHMQGGNLLKDCFSQIVALHIHDGKVSWQQQKIISYHSDNWEGITSYKKGVLTIVDGKPPGVNCRLAYFEMEQ